MAYVYIIYYGVKYIYLLHYKCRIYAVYILVYNDI